MQSPYTPSPLDAIMAAQSALGVTLTAVALFRPRRPWPATAAMILSIWLAVLSLEGNAFHELLERERCTRERRDFQIRAQPIKLSSPRAQVE